MSDDHPLSADETLAAAIADALVTNGLVAIEQRDELSKRIATGKITEEDWQVLIESALPGNGEYLNGG